MRETKFIPVDSSPLSLSSSNPLLKSGSFCADSKKQDLASVPPQICSLPVPRAMCLATQSHGHKATADPAPRKGGDSYGETPVPRTARGQVILSEVGTGKAPGHML